MGLQELDFIIPFKPLKAKRERERERERVRIVQE
jgi:hypothetical protein